MGEQIIQEFHKAVKPYLLEKIKEKPRSFEELGDLTKVFYKKLHNIDPNSDICLHGYVDPITILLDELKNDRVKLMSEGFTYVETNQQK